MHKMRVKVNKKSPASIHRTYCNLVKKQMLYDAVHFIKNENENENENEISLLDLCSGRGGDMFKWYGLGIDRVYGVDSDKKSVVEAISRHKKSRYALQKFNSNTKVSFYNVSALDGVFIKSRLKQKVEIVSCMFALHYFFKDEGTLNQLFSVISSNLKDNGIFIGIGPDSHFINKLLNPEDPYTNPNVKIEKNNSNSYNFMITDNTNNDYFSFKGESLEYIIDKTQLIKTAKKYNLEPIKIGKYNTFSNLYNLLPEFKKSNISELYFIFSFKKIKK
jgi:mRNA (guanine-N7-)-methyltransferase